MTNGDIWGDIAGYDIFVIAKPLGPGDWRTLLRGYNTDHPVLIYYNSTALGMYNNTQYGFQQFGSLTLDSSARVLLYVNINSSRQYSAALNGGTLTSPTGSGGYDNKPLYALGAYQGGYQPWGEINEMIIVPNCTALQRQQIEQYLNYKWFYASPSTGTATTFYYNGGDQYYTVPAGYNALDVYMWGAGGQGAVQPPYGHKGGAGAMVQGTMKVKAGQVLTIIVGEGPTNPSGYAYGGGGRAYQADGVWYGSASGGRSAIQVESGTDYVTAGAGAGGGGGAQGGAGGILTGFDGPGNDGEGKGGTQTAGGVPQGTGQPGTLKKGGSASIYSYSGAGGGGYYGGAGGGYGGGGGGSSLISNLSLIPGTSVFGYESSNLYSAPNTSSPYYASGAAAGGVPNNSGVGNGLVVVVPRIVTVPSLFTRTFQPIDIPGLVLWLDGSDASTMTGTTTMTAWKDKSGMGYVANSLSNGVSAPSWVKNLVNGNGAVQYSAGNGSVVSSFVLAQTMSIFEVYYPINQSNYGPFVEQSSIVNSNPGFCVYTGGGGVFLINNGSGPTYVNTDNVTKSNKWQMVEAINPDPANGNTMAFYFNGVTKVSGTTQSGTTTITDNLYINTRGGANSVSSNSYLGELLIYNVALTAAQRQEVEGYLAWKWFPNGWTFAPATLSFTSGGSFTVPSGKTSIKVYLWGAGGGCGGSVGGGGSGAMIMGVLSTTPGETLTINVGGGGGYPVNTTYSGSAGGGGGLTSIQRGGTQVVVAGSGGGGSGYGYPGFGGCGTVGNQAYSGGSSYNSQVLGRTRGEISSLGGDSHNGGGANSGVGNGQEGVDYGLGATGGAGYTYGGNGGYGGFGAGAGSSYTANLTMISGESTFGFATRDGTAPGTGYDFYVAGVAVGASGTGNGGPGLVVIVY